MKPYRSLSLPVRSVWIFIFLLAAVSLPARAADRTKSQVPHQIQKFHADDPHTRAGFEAFYNSDYDRAIREFELSLKLHPDDPAAVNHLLSGIMFKEMYRIGALDSELYAKEGFLASKQFPVDTKVQAKIKELTDQALALSEAKLKVSPSDVDALYARGVTRGLRSTYMALVEKAWFAALRSTVGARKDHERVLDLDPKNTDAMMVVGIHNYVIGSVSFPVKIAASIVGLSGNRKKGIDLLYQCANGGGENSVDAKIALSLFLRREQRYGEAIQLIEGLTASYPHNYLFILELANLNNAAGHAPEAIALYRRIMQLAQQGAFPDAHVEMASYGLGEALRGQRDFKAAAEAYERVLEFQKADPDIKLRATLGAGEMYDAQSLREQAVKRYQDVLAADKDGPRADLAKKHLKQPYRPAS